MSVIEISLQIEQKIKLLESGRKIINERATKKAQAISDYERAIAVTILKLKNNQITEWDGQSLDSKLPANLIEKIAKGICWEEKLVVERAEGYYKAAVTGMHSIMAELNGLQSLNRHIE